MRPPRYSIAGLLALVAICGVAFASLRSPSYFWANAVFTVVLGALVVATINVVYGMGRSRAFWAGYLIAGGTYFSICAVPMLRDGMCPRLVTEFVFDLVYARLNPTAATSSPTPPAMAGYMVMPQPVNPPPQAAMSSAYMVAMPPPSPPRDPWVAWTEPERSYGVGYEIGSVRLVSSEPFRQIGHGLVSLLCGVLGGLYARSRYALREAREGLAASPALS